MTTCSPIYSSDCPRKDPFCVFVRLPRSKAFSSRFATAMHRGYMNVLASHAVPRKYQTSEWSTHVRPPLKPLVYLACQARH